MDYRCPHCRAALKRRSLQQAVVARMEVECPHCRQIIHLNVHRAEVVAVMLSFGAIVVLGYCAYAFQNQSLVLYALAAAMAGAGTLPLIEHTILRNWPRYAATARHPKT